MNGPSYAIRLPKTDGDGIDLAGVHQIESRVPLGTSTGWNLRSPAHRGPSNLCVLTGSYFPFATTRAERAQSGDPRPSLQERYGTHQGFVVAVQKAAQQLVKERFLLKVDADADISAVEASTVLKQRSIREGGRPWRWAVRSSDVEAGPDVSAGDEARDAHFDG